MVKKTLLSVVVCILVGLYSCASQYPILAQQAKVKADEFKEYCIVKGLQLKVMAKADSLYSLAKDYSEAGKDQEAFYLMELSAIHYQLALSQQEVIETNKEITKLEQDLVKARDKLDTYKKVLSELESINQ